MSARPTCALVLLCVVQGCERFAFLAMLPLFVLYLHHRHAFTEPSALLLLGVMSALSYVGGLPAGILTDRKLGALGALLLGGALLTVGYGALALDYPTLLWPALAAMTVGHSLFNPSISTLFGSMSRMFVANAVSCGSTSPSTLPGWWGPCAESGCASGIAGTDCSCCPPS